MSIKKVITVNFGSRKGGLSTVGYALYDSAGAIIGSRITSGVVEVVSGKGIYQADITFDDTFRGQVLWDTGEATPLYASVAFDYRSISEGPALTQGVISVDGGLKKKDLEKIFKKLDSILKIVKGNKTAGDEIVEGIQDMALKVIHQNNNVKNDLKTLIKNLNESIEDNSKKDYSNKITQYISLNESLKMFQKKIEDYNKFTEKNIQTLQESLKSVNIKIEELNNEKNLNQNQWEEIKEGILTIGNALETIIDSQKLNTIVKNLR